MTTTTTERLLYRPAEAAEVIGVSRARLYQLVAAGLVPSVRIGGTIRIPVLALREWIQRQVAEHAEAR